MKHVSRDEAKKWIVAWFQKHAAAQKNEIAKNTSENYFLKAWIDSLSFISFIADLEAKFDVSFSNEEFQDREFSTIDGLAGIIAHRYGKK